jgi:gas vesicle protein
MFQDTLSDVEHDKDESIRQLKNQCNNNIEKLKRENERAIEELQYELGLPDGM